MSDHSNNSGDDRRIITPVFGRHGKAPVIPLNPRRHDEVDVTVNGVAVKLIRQDILDVGAQAIVISQFTDKVSEGGVALAVMRRYGSDVNEAYGAVLTSKKTKYGHFAQDGLHFFHVPTVKTGAENAAKNVYDAVFSTLFYCGMMGISSIAFPALCTGPEGELQDEQSARTIGKAIYDYAAKDSDKIPAITIAIWDYDDKNRFAAFTRILKSPNQYMYFNPSQEIGKRLPDPRRRLHEDMKKGNLMLADIVKGQDGTFTLQNPLATKQTALVISLSEKKPR